MDAVSQRPDGHENSKSRVNSVMVGISPQRDLEGCNESLTVHGRRKSMNDGTREEASFIMRTHRKPLNSPKPAAVTYTNFKNLHIMQGNQSQSLKRCFSKETLDLSRQKIRIVSKQSKVDISMLPPKRARLGDFEFASSSFVPSSSSQRQQFRSLTRVSSETNRTTTKRCELKRLNQPSHHKSFSKSVSFSGNRNNGDVFRRVGDQQRLQLKQKDVRESSPQFLNFQRNNMGDNMSFFLVSMKHFPREEWKENGYSSEMLREIIFLSDSSSEIFPVTINPMDGKLVLRIIGSSNARHIHGILSNRREKSLLYGILKSPFTFTFKLISGVIKWIVGNQ